MCQLWGWCLRAALKEVPVSELLTARSLALEMVKVGASRGLLDPAADSV
jgi:hypothetical protein